MRQFASLGLAFGLSVLATQACTCVALPNAKQPVESAAVVFRGFALKSEALPQHPEMRGRSRFVVTFRVREYWKGNEGKELFLYHLPSGTDCNGGDYLVGKEYLIYASKAPSKDYKFDEFFWFGWTDAVPTGQPIITPLTACMPGGDTSELSVKSNLRMLGKGSRPAR
jgi:hypothetical protein